MACFRYLRILALLVLSLSVSGNVDAAEPRQKILFFMTSDIQLYGSGKKTGVWLDAVSIPYYKLKEAGYDIAMGSINGLRPPIDPRSEQNAGPSASRFLQDKEAMALFNDTVPLADLKAGSFKAIYLPGGHGALWDHLDNAQLKQLLTQFAQQGKIIAALDHAVVALAGVTIGDGSLLLKGRNVTGFTHAEETVLGFADVVPAYGDVVLGKCGGVVASAAAFTPHAVQDANLNTGQNPQSAEQLAQMLLKALNNYPKEH